MSDFLTDDDMIQKVGTIMTNLNQNQRLQELAKSNGLDVKNTIQFTEETTNNIAVSVVALMLAKRESDPDYGALVRAGMNHRKIRVDLINKYKDQANQLIDRYKSEMRDNLAG
jgi:hypothetical protein